MSDRFPAEIRIGGPVPENLIAQLCQKIEGAVVSLDWGKEEFIPTTKEELLLATLPNPGKVLILVNDQARYGCFEDLEYFLWQSGIAYDRVSDAYCDSDGMIVQFRLGLGTVEHTADQNGHPTVSLEQVREALQLLKALKVSEATKQLEEIVGPEVPPLKPFQINETKETHEDS